MNSDLLTPLPTNHRIGLGHMVYGFKIRIYLNVVKLFSVLEGIIHICSVYQVLVPHFSNCTIKIVDTSSEYESVKTHGWYISDAVYKISYHE